MGRLAKLQQHALANPLFRAGGGPADQSYFVVLGDGVAVGLTVNA